MNLAKTSKHIFNIVLLVALAYFTYLLLKIILQYIPIDYDVAFLRIKQRVIDYPLYKFAFFTHVFTSILSILAGFTQFSKTIQVRYRKIHRIMGYLYIASILLLACPSGFYIALFANGGVIAKTAFVTLSILWFLTTLFAFTSIKKGYLFAHQKWMYYSYALTLSAITLRIWKVVLVYLFEPNPMDAYRIVAWLGFIPNLVVAYILLKEKNNVYEKN